MYVGSPNSGIYKIPVANPGSARDQQVNNFRFGHLRFGQGRSFAGRRNGTVAGNKDDTGVYLSRHSPDEEPHYCGEWWIDNAGHLNLVERMLSQYEEGGGVNPRHTRYVFALSFSPGECRGESNIPGLPTQAVTVILRR